MKVYFTEQALIRFEDAMDFLLRKQRVPVNKVEEIKIEIIDAAESLTNNPNAYQTEPLLKSLGLSHRRILCGNFKIIYRVEGNIVYITDVFDSRQNPEGMKP